MNERKRRTKTINEERMNELMHNEEKEERRDERRGDAASERRGRVMIRRSTGKSRRRRITYWQDKSRHWRVE
jgi:hypothetical protein